MSARATNNFSASASPSLQNYWSHIVNHVPSQFVNHVALDTMVAPTMKMVLLKTKRREQAPALRYEIDFSAKVAEMRGRLF